MKIALIHDWLTGMRGGEKCLEEFSELFPEADIFTLFYFPDNIASTINRQPVHNSFLQHFPFIKSHYRYFLPLFPSAIKSFNLSGYDLVISSSHCVAKGVRTGPHTCHVSYIHTPMRYVWDQFESYSEGDGYVNGISRWGLRVFRSWLQQWDIRSNQGIFSFVANSRNVADRIWRCYHKKADVIYPPVDCSRYSASKMEGKYYLMLTAFVPYKKVDLAIQAFNHTGFPLKIIGSGPQERYLKSMAHPNIKFLGSLTDSEIADAYASCKAVIFPGEEDFGIVPLEAMASGKPVIAFGRGGVLESVIPLNQGNPITPTGVFFEKQTPESVIEAVKYFESRRDRFDPEQIRKHVDPFDRSCFKEKISQLINQKYAEFQELNNA